MSTDEKSKKFYITTTIPYVNADPHIGFALEVIQADVSARYQRSQGCEVIFNTGTDEYGLKIYRKAVEESKDPQEYVNEYAEHFAKLKEILNLSYTNFIRTTSPHHKKAAQEFWNRCLKSGDIYKANYQTKYCVGCELEKTDSELENGRCPVHPNLNLEEREEENYFFRFSNYKDKLLKLYDKNPNFVIPDFRFNEIKKFVEQGLNDFSVSRLKSKMPWGVPVPDDHNHVMYVWFDALVNYISTLGWPEDLNTFNNFWPGTQMAGKDNLRQQSAMWQAMLMSAGLPNSKQIFIHGFITVDGQKMSKSLGNVIDPIELVKKYGVDSVRYYLLREISSYEDGDFSIKKFKERHNNELVNGLGNLIARVVTIGEKISPLKFSQDLIEGEIRKEYLDGDYSKAIFGIYHKNMEDFYLNAAISTPFYLISVTDKYISDKEPWKEKDQEKLSKTIINACYSIDKIAYFLEPFLPDTVKKIREQISFSESQIIIKKGEHLFSRLN